MTVAAAGTEPFAFAHSLQVEEGLPVPDWEAIERWIDTVPEKARAVAWEGCERAWLLHLRDALGSPFHLDESHTAMVLSSLDPQLSRYTLEFMGQTLRRITHVLKDIAEVPPWGKDLLVVFDDQDTYYRYASRYYPEQGTFSFSSGMHISKGCGHYITMKADIRSIEPVIAHEMTHGCLGHLPLPLWLNEGLAVNTEHRLCGSGAPLFSVQEMHQKHLAFWGPQEIQQFWSGKSFQRTDEGSMLSYDLARVLVDQLSGDWPVFARFVNAASYEDAGNAASISHLGAELGALAAALLDRDDVRGFGPNPQSWEESPQHAPQDRRFTFIFAS